MTGSARRDAGGGDAGSAPTRKADGIRRINRAAAIFPAGEPGLQGRRRRASLARSQVTRLQINAEPKVNGTIFQSEIISS
ncbi:hypothetical protein AM352_05340 [Citrobacter koseri]|nr:hypothetical protein AM352_05340 [Citrobacter koseri]